MSDLNLPVLLIDDEPQILFSFKVMLSTEGVKNISTIDDSRKVLPYLEKNDAAVAVLDLNMPFISGFELLDKIKQGFPHVAVIVVTAINDLEKAVDCMKKGAIDYLVKPVEKSRFISSVKNALEIRDLRHEVVSLKQQISTLKHHLLTDELENEAAFSSYLTNSNKMKNIFHYVETISKSSEPLLITGETGVGKELISKVIHDISDVKGEFIAVNVAGLDDNMFSDALFGHRKGAYTGAHEDRKGLIVKASKGTLLLDEIGDLSELSQVKLLRLIEEGVYYPLGSDVFSNSTARLIASTNRNIQKRMSEGKFRKDLYYRLAALHVKIPPLRERVEDIPLLMNYFLEEAVRSMNKKIPAYPREVITLLSNYTFPGNVRELKAMVFDAVAEHKSGVLSLNSFKRFIQEKGENVKTDMSFSETNAISKLSFSGRFPTLKEAEDLLIEEALKRSKGNQGIAASLLGLTRQALNKRLKRAGNKSRA